MPSFFGKPKIQNNVNVQIDHAIDQSLYGQAIGLCVKNQLASLPTILHQMSDPQLSYFANVIQESPVRNPLAFISLSICLPHIALSSECKQSTLQMIQAEEQSRGPSYHRLMTL